MSTFGLTWNLKSPDRNKQFISNIPRKVYLQERVLSSERKITWNSFTSITCSSTCTCMLTVGNLHIRSRRLRTLYLTWSYDVTCGSEVVTGRFVVFFLFCFFFFFYLFVFFMVFFFYTVKDFLKKKKKKKGRILFDPQQAHNVKTT